MVFDLGWAQNRAQPLPYRSFGRVWFFDSLDTADEVNQAIGFPAGYGRVRWLARLWPDFEVYSNSTV
jgi:hypothetical protein